MNFCVGSVMDWSIKKVSCLCAQCIQENNAGFSGSERNHGTLSSIFYGLFVYKKRFIAELSRFTLFSILQSRSIALVTNYCIILHNITFFLLIVSESFYYELWQ